jgi:NitT/TauT family transport system substrate-binding protein
MNDLRAKTISRRTFTAALGGAAAAALTRPAYAEPISPLNVVTILVDTSSQPFYATEMGFFKKSGLDAKTTIVASGAVAIPAVVSGTYDIGNSSVGSIAAAIEKGLPLTIVAAGGVYDSGAPTTAIFVRDKEPIRSGKDLNGKTIGVNGLSDLIYVASRAWLARTGGDLDTMKFVEVPFSAQGAALQRGTIDAVAGAEPAFTIAKLRYGARAIAFPYDYVNAKKPFTITAWFATIDWAQAHPDVIKKFQASMTQTARWANANQARSATILGKYIALDPDVLKTMARSKFATSLDAGPIQPALNAYYDAKLLPQPIDAAKLLVKS